MSEKISTSCGHCGQKYQLKKEFIGKKVRCKKCENSFLVKIKKTGNELSGAPLGVQPKPAGHLATKTVQSAVSHSNDSSSSKSPLFLMIGGAATVLLAGIGVLIFVLQMEPEEGEKKAAEAVKSGNVSTDAKVNEPETEKNLTEEIFRSYKVEDGKALVYGYEKNIDCGGSKYKVEGNLISKISSSNNSDNDASVKSNAGLDHIKFMAVFKGQFLNQSKKKLIDYEEVGHNDILMSRSGVVNHDTPEFEKNFDPSFLMPTGYLCFDWIGNGTENSLKRTRKVTIKVPAWFGSSKTMLFQDKLIESRKSDKEHPVINLEVIDQYRLTKKRGNRLTIKKYTVFRTIDPKEHSFSGLSESTYYFDIEKGSVASGKSSAKGTLKIFGKSKPFSVKSHWRLGKPKPIKMN